ncbi:glycosyltransferase [Muricoccus pecuniae]|uniref:Glycosyltransferase involved in cell wall biosynthesis n=1 Tax=Muricoccus pecuniae TaxID=693023 RepID=A0A840XZM0_9PROT|nr:glycosyltransferase [Roseomonas pecuniae]MBB5693915.1 glycosyltransferase involved in cell wall biosynthesis [Roseomonas pecuniae]
MPDSLPIHPAPLSTGAAAPLRCLWLARSMPFPWTAGDRIYTAKLAGAFAAAGVDVTFVGLEGEAPPAPMPNIRWHIVPGGQGGRVGALASPMPLVAARHATAAYRSALAELAGKGPWDVVVVDQYGMGWVLRNRALLAGRPVVVFVTHDHEESVTGMQWRDRTASLPRRAVLLQNHLKTRWFERWIARRSDLITTITEADAALFSAEAPGVPVLPLVPGYDGARAAGRAIGPETPRAVVLFGSYRWSAKQANLRIFLDQADPVLAEAGVEIRVVGDMPDDLRRSLEGRYRAARFTGFVEDPAPHLAAARLAVVAEPIGGGFKMKLLEYVFNRVPVAALDVCASGLPDSVRANMVLAPELDGLLRAVLGVIDDPARLGALQEGAFAAAEGAFDWADRGRALRDAVLERRAALARPAGAAAR